MNILTKSNQQLQNELANAKARITELELDKTRSEKALRQLKRDAARYLDLAEVILVALDSQANITMIGGKGCEVLGYQSDELVGQNWFKVCVPPEHYEQIFVVYKKIMTGAIENVEYYENEILTKSGEKRFISWHNSLSKDPSGNPVGILSSGIDITARKLAENTLRDSEATLHKVQEIAHIGSWDWDVLNNTLKFSPELYDIYGITPDDFDGNMLTLYDRIIHPDDRKKIHKATELTIKKSKPQQIYFRVVRPDGAIRYVWGDGTATFNDKGVLVRLIGIIQDITDRKRIEDALHQSEAHFRDMIDASPVPFALNDAQKNITYLNPSFVKTYGYNLSDIPTLDDWWPKAYPDEKYRQWVMDTWLEHLDRCKRNGTSFEPVELTIQSKDGSPKTVLAGVTALTTADRTNHLVTLYDVTDRKKAELAYRESESRYRMIVETAQEGIWTIDTEDKTSFVNPRMAEMLGYSTDEMQGHSMFEFMDNDGRKIAVENVERRKAGISEQHHFKFLHKDGSPVWTELTANPLQNSDGAYLGSLAMITDITERRRSEQALRDTQTLLLRTESLAHIGSWELNLVTNHVQWSPEMYRIYQVDPDEYPEIDFSIAMSRNHPGDQEKNNDYLKRVIESGITSPIEYRIILPDGSIRHLWTESRVIKNTAGQITHLVGSVQDITDRVEAEAALLEGSRRFRALFEQSSFGVAKIDSQTGNFTEINQRYCDILAYSPQEMLKMDFHTITVAEDLQSDLENMTRLRAGEITSFQREKRYIHKSGSILWVHISVLPLWAQGNNPDYHLAIVEDITERKHTEEKLQRQQEEQQQLINNIADAIIVIDEYGTVQTFSRSAETIFGYNAEEILGQNISILMPIEDGDQRDAIVLSNLTEYISRTIGIPREVNGLRKNGEIFPMRLSLAELPKSTEGVRRFIGACHDLTIEKLQEEQLRRSQKMDALGKLTGGIAHDYNNMLGVILGYSRLLQDALMGNAKLSKYIDEIYHASERGTKLSRKLLAFSRNLQPETTSVYINEVLTAEQDMLKKTLTPRINLTLDLANNIWPINIDSGEFEDAILNLSINAMHAMESSGNITITTRNEQLSQQEAKKLDISSGDYVVLTISDTGSGIDPSDLGQIFDPFFTTKGEGGVGLGLSMVYGFVQRSSGGITVNSIPGRGSQFTLYFPRHLQVDFTEIVAKTLEVDDLAGSETILVVDDEPAMANLAKEILTINGYQVVTANSAAEALNILSHESIDLLLSDVIMPGVDGYQLASKVQKQYPQIKIQLISGYTDDRHLGDGSPELEGRLLHKPFTPQNLLRHLRDLFDSANKMENKNKKKVMIMDDDENVRKLFEINLTKLGYHTVFANNGEDAIEEYRRALESEDVIDAIILDLTIPGGMDGKETAQKILDIDPNAKLIVSSGDSLGSVMINYQEYGFRAAIEKNFDRKTMAKTLEQVFSSD